TLTPTDRTRMHRAGIPPLTPTQALHLLDTSLRSDAPTLAPIRLDLAALRRAPEVPHMLRALVRPTARRAVRPAGEERAAAFTDRLRSVGAEERVRLVLDV
ncbi:hypothetical protein WDH52_24590, partial [Streptomyces sp. TRM70308]|uniref:hypothetical protein n=2 Tax=unclassified Streptomyces TaxID=2593676 RepID=UPI003D041D76